MVLLTAELIGSIRTSVIRKVNKQDLRTMLPYKQIPVLLYNRIAEVLKHEDYFRIIVPPCKLASI